jgi:hypothetical protein
MIRTSFSWVKEYMAWGLFYESSFFFFFLQIKQSKSKWKVTVRTTTVIKKNPASLLWDENVLCHHISWEGYLSAKLGASRCFVPQDEPSTHGKKHTDLKIPTMLGGAHRDLMGKIKNVSPATGKGFLKSSCIMPKDLGHYWWINIYGFLVVCLKLLSKRLIMIRLKPIIHKLSQALSPCACRSDELLDLLFLDTTKRWVQTYVGVVSCQTHHSWAQRSIVSRCM